MHIETHLLVLAGAVSRLERSRSLKEEGAEPAVVEGLALGSPSICIHASGAMPPAIRTIMHGTVEMDCVHLMRGEGKGRPRQLQGCSEADSPWLYVQASANVHRLCGQYLQNT